MSTDPAAKAYLEAHPEASPTDLPRSEFFTANLPFDSQTREANDDIESRKERTVSKLEERRSVCNLFGASDPRGFLIGPKVGDPGLDEATVLAKLASFGNASNPDAGFPGTTLDERLESYYRRVAAGMIVMADEKYRAERAVVLAWAARNHAHHYALSQHEALHHGRTGNHAKWHAELGIAPPPGPWESFTHHIHMDTGEPIWFPVPPRPPTAEERREREVADLRAEVEALKRARGV